MDQRQATVGLISEQKVNVETAIGVSYFFRFSKEMWMALKNIER